MVRSLAFGVSACLVWTLAISARGSVLRVSDDTDQAAVIGACLALGIQTEPSSSTEIAYDEFMRLSFDERNARFDRITPENKATLKRTHAERWLKANDKNLTRKQKAVVREAIEFITPELYRHRQDPDSRKKEEELKTRLVCTLGQSRVIEAFTFLPPEPKPTWRDAIDAWLSWFADCVVK